MFAFSYFCSYVEGTHPAWYLPPSEQTFKYYTSHLTVAGSEFISTTTLDEQARYCMKLPYDPEFDDREEFETAFEMF